MNLVETIKSIKRDALSYKDNNENLMKDKEKEDHINTKLFQSLDVIEKKGG
jgi:hypothetical protein